MPDGTRKNFWGDTESEAETAKQAFRICGATPSAKSDPLDPNSTLLDFAEQVWRPTIHFLQPSTRTKYLSLWNCHIGPRLGHRPIGEITFHEVQSIVNDLASGGRVDREGEPTGEPLGAKQTRDVLDKLRSILQLAVQQGVIPYNPAVGVKGPRKPGKRVRVLTVGKAFEIMEATKGERIHAPAVLAMVFALRRGECAGAKWSHIDRKSLTWTVSEQIRQDRGGAAPGAPKGGNARVLHLSAALIEIIDGAGNQDSDYICGWKGEKWIPPDKITSDWATARSRFGLDDWHFHDLRHGAASILHRLGVDFLTISAILGHRDADTTLIYTDVDATAMRKGLGKLGRAFAKSGRRAATVGN